MAELRKLLFPYGMAKNADGTWTFFNRRYKPVGIVGNDWAAWDVPEHKVRFKRQPRVSTLEKLDVHGKGDGERIYFYNDECVPTRSAPAMKSYLDKLQLLLALETEANE